MSLAFPVTEKWRQVSKVLSIEQRNDERALKRLTWQGKNLLGEILTKIRIELAGDY